MPEEDFHQVDVRLNPEMQASYTNLRFRYEFGPRQKKCGLGEWVEEIDAFGVWLMKQREDLLSGEMQMPALCHYGEANIKNSEGSTQPMWVSVFFPDSGAPGVMDLVAHVLEGKYKVSVRIDHPSSRWARKARRKAERASGVSQGTPRSSDSGSVNLFLPGMQNNSILRL